MQARVKTGRKKVGRWRGETPPVHNVAAFLGEKQQALGRPVKLLNARRVHHQLKQEELGREPRDRWGSCWTERRSGRVCGERGAACPPGACVRAVLPLA